MFVNGHREGRTGRLVRVLASFGMLGVALAAGTTLMRAQTPAHDAAYWDRIAAAKYEPPAGEPLAPLLTELSGFLASPDPHLRDDIAYSTLVAWIYQQRIVPPEERRRLLGLWTANLTRGIGERGTDSVFGRSFSALSLGLLVALDNAAPYLEQAEFDRLLDAAVTYLRDERDVRGFDPAHGWMHSVAHTADLLKFLARSPHLTPAGQARVLGAIADKMAVVDDVLTHGEDERLARAVLSIAARTDLDEEALRGWATSLRPPRRDAAPSPSEMAADQNRKHVLVSLYAVLSTDTRDLPSLAAARAIVLDVMKTMMAP